MPLTLSNNPAMQQKHRVGSQAMRGALITATALAACAFAAPRWEPVMNNSQGTYSIDPASTTRDGDQRAFNSALDYRTPQTRAPGKTHQSVETKFQVNCRTKMARIIHMTYYSGPKLSGSVVERQGMLQDWIEVDPTSPVYRLMRHVC